MTILLMILAGCTLGAFLISLTDVPARRTLGHALRSSMLLTGFVLCGSPLLILFLSPHPFAALLTLAAFGAWATIGALWSFRLDPGAALAPVPAWLLRPWWLPDWIVWAILLASVVILFLAGGSP